MPSINRILVELYECTHDRALEEIILFGAAVGFDAIAELRTQSPGCWLANG